MYLAGTNNHAWSFTFTSLVCVHVTVIMHFYCVSSLCCCIVAGFDLSPVFSASCHSSPVVTTVYTGERKTAVLFCVLRLTPTADQLPWALHQLHISMFCQILHPVCSLSTHQRHPSHQLPRHFWIWTRRILPRKLTQILGLTLALSLTSK
jgi:hypothetical protein